MVAVAAEVVFVEGEHGRVNQKMVVKFDCQEIEIHWPLRVVEIDLSHHYTQNNIAVNGSIPFFMLICSNHLLVAYSLDLILHKPKFHCAWGLVM